MAHSPTQSDYLPGFGHDWLLPLYDPFSRLTGIGKYHQQLLDQAGIAPGERVLEIGCGTGNLLLRAAAAEPAAKFTGLDPDPRALKRAGKKAARKRLAVELDHGFAQQLPYSTASFTRVLSAFMLHHLPVAAKSEALAEVRRVLEPRGTLHVMDIAGHTHHARGWFARRSHRSAYVQDQLGDGVPDRLREAGFTDVRVVAQRDTRLGHIAFFEARAS
ncbi:class I SAM-dependent methyltransferase [Hoyosella sp. YIM 151337]|uniref:class I SAM-dependent methyltransferase n=1 Tax=Hoyosella sp. YIM 151337 TaxID=2992742 RepID=UPI002235DD91|nr:class I SAM-dependent methyltransferase [Hoyosella sp. YIM 151337]MCW4351716.1 class I SAM-dependent methyltransferase [Hoyosella sp. YIM 151337]